MIGPRLLTSIPLGLCLAACQPGGGNESAGAGNIVSANATLENGASGNAAEDNEAAAANAVAAVPEGCPVAGTSGWSAKLAVVPEPLLEVSGTVTEGSTGYKISLTEGALDKTDPPTQHVNLVVVEPTGPVTQVVTNYTPFVRMRRRSDSFKAVIIDCNGKEIARIDNVHR